jgi:hypothetical protein
MSNQPVITKSMLTADLGALGLNKSENSAVMVHTRMSTLGWVGGGSQTTINALTEAVAPRRTPLVLTGWEERTPHNQREWDEQARTAYCEEAHALTRDSRLRNGSTVACQKLFAPGLAPSTAVTRCWPANDHSRATPCRVTCAHLVAAARADNGSEADAGRHGSALAIAPVQLR